jgi:GTPase involved in cell partitioning and DNA repair
LIRECVNKNQEIKELTETNQNYQKDLKRKIAIISEMRIKDLKENRKSQSQEEIERLLLTETKIRIDSQKEVVELKQLLKSSITDFENFKSFFIINLALKRTRWFESPRWNKK